MRIDSHQHFWKYDPVIYDWINEDMGILKAEFLPGHLALLLDENNFHGCIAVQSEQSERHNDFLLDLAEKNSFIKGVAGWIDLRADNVEEKLDQLRPFTKLKGFRHILQGELKKDMMLEPEFIRGLKALDKRGYTYDILVYPFQFPYIIELLRFCPNQKFILDHLGKPSIKEGRIKEWKKDMERLASFENLYCKMSGMVTEADCHTWKYADFIPYMDVVVESFGTDRILFGSDWPVCLLAGGYADILNIMERYFSSFTETEQQNVFGLNAMKFYNLN